MDEDKDWDVDENEKWRYFFGGALVSAVVLFFVELIFGMYTM